mmetsp:Transcript_9793/g.32519  ORF Transcript_9793/g.32519 Transcript_9793/m.32519 type:complete len:319 (-) Transcript_9793:125-1081(-)
MATPVTKANYAHAETAVILSDYVKKIAKGTGSGGVGVMLHQRAGHDPDDRTILRPNFDTMYSFAVLDLTCAATVVLPQTERYQILEVIDEEHWIPLIAAEPGRYELTKESVGSRFAFAFVRTRVNMQDPADLRLAAEVQDGIAVEQAEPGSYQQPLTYDMDEILALRKAYNERKGKEGVTSEMIFGKKGELSEEMRNFGVAIGWGGLPKEGAVYPFPDAVDSTDPHTLTLRDVPNHPRAFWSVTVYDEDGFARGGHYNVNSAFAKPDADGAFVIHFGGDQSQPNFLEIYPGWNVALRIYSPVGAYFDGSWTSPQLRRC